MATDITLTSGMRSNLLSLQGTVDLLNRTQTRLATGKKVNSALDDPSAFFKAQSLDARASDISALKDEMGQALQTVQAADKGIKAITTLVQQAKALAQKAAAAVDAPAAAEYGAQFDVIIGQIDDLAADAGYQGINLLNGNDLTVNFENSHSLSVTGFTATAAGALSITLESATAWTEGASGTAQASVVELDAALVTLRDNASTMASNLSIITTRMDFSTNMINVLSEGSAKLTLADTNEEGANMLMLQTRQALSTTALSLAAQASQSVLRLFG